MDLSRSAPILGESNLEKLSQKKVMIFGLGGVGGYALEALVRSGIRKFILIDGDVISSSNINRQIIATNKNINKSKVEEFKSRLIDINPDIEVTTISKFILPNDLDSISFVDVDYIIDCIDTVSTKTALIEFAKANNVNIISSLGAGNRIEPSLVKVSDIYKTSYDPLAKVLRGELRKRNIKHLKVVYSTEIPTKYVVNSENGRHSPASMIFVPATIGLSIAKEVIFDLIK